MKNKPFANKRKTLLSYKSYREEMGGGGKESDRLEELLDPGTFKEYYTELETSDPLRFPGYKEKLSTVNVKRKDALICGTGKAGGMEVACALLDKDFLMGSMGTVVGEKLTRIIEKADEDKLPLIIYSASGGARMQEGMFSLLQMAKTSAAINRFKEHGGLFISVLTHPTTGGVSASFASLGDIILAEPGALIGFAGPRVIEKTIGHKLPEGFQRAEFQLEHGFVDKIVSREEMPGVIKSILKLHSLPEYNDGTVPGVCDTDKADDSLPATENISAYERVLRARDKDRPRNTEIVENIFDEFTELAGDRLGKEDLSVMGGVAFLDGHPVTVIAQRKGKDTKENIRYNFGMPNPSGYRKALRLMKQAEKFGRPVITFIDTPGAYPGMEAEENGQSTAIAENLAAMSSLRVPVISVVTGEGSSGGALAIGVADKVLVLENAVYSILSPEGFATILWKDGDRAAEACEIMRMTARDLYADKIADMVIKEPEGCLNSGNLKEFCAELKKIIYREITKLNTLKREDLVNARYEKYRHFEKEHSPLEKKEKEA